MTWTKADPKLGDLSKIVQEAKDDCEYIKDILYKKYVLSLYQKMEINKERN